MSHRGLRTVVRAAERVVGRPRLAKLARLVTNEVRLDAHNTIETNGERDVQALALTAAPPVVVFDVGAHCGEWSESLLSQVPADRVVELHAFEPSAATATRATATLGGRATVHQLALSDSAGPGRLNVVHEGAGSNSLVVFRGDQERHAGAVEEITLSTVAAEVERLGVARVTLLKSDAEGHDLAVLRGAEPLLAEQRIDLVQFEYNIRWADGDVFLRHAFELLQRHGYSLGKVTARGVEHYPRYHPELEKFVEGNYLAWLPSWDDKVPTIPWWGG